MDRTPRRGLPRGLTIVVVAALSMLVISLFLPWDLTAFPTPIGDTRRELVSFTVLTILTGALALAYPVRATALIAACTSVIAATDVGPVLWPDGQGSYGPGAWIAVVAGTALGTIWLFVAAKHPPRYTLTGLWLLMPAFAAFVLAGATLPWVVVSEVGMTSGARSAWQLLVGGEVASPAGYPLVRTVICFVLLLAVGSSIAAVVVKRARVSRTASLSCAVAAAVTLVMQAWIALGGDAVATVDGALGVRVAVVGFVMLSMLWLSDSRRRPAEDEAPAQQPAPLSPQPGAAVPAPVAGK